MSSKKKFSAKRFFKRLGKVLLVILGILLVLCIIFHKYISDGIHLLKMYDVTVDPDTLVYTEMHLTNEQMLTDFQYMYDTFYTNSFVKDQADRYLGLDYAAIYDDYRERVSNCKDDYEFFCLMMSLCAKLPGSHDYLHVPTTDVPSVGMFPLSYECNTQEVIDANFSFNKQFEDRMFSYDQKYMLFAYLGGDYVAFAEGFEEEDMIPGIANGRLLTLDGKSVEDALQEIDSINKISYDARLEKPFCFELIFNDGYGRKYVAEIEMPDGEIITMDLYNSCEQIAACYYRDRLYPEHGKDPEAAEETEEAAESAESGDAEPAVKRCFSVEKVPDRKLVVITITGCEDKDNEAFIEEVTNALNEVDPVAVIIDNRSNGGGSVVFVTEGVCPAFFDYDYEFISNSRAPINDMTDLLYSNRVYATFFEKGLEKEADCYSYCEDLSFKGKASRSYDIYVINGQSTCSSGDILAGVMGAQPNVTLVGSNTHGEGFTGHPMDYYLPESKFLFTVDFSVSDIFPDNNCLGTVPDVFVANDWHDWLNRLEYAEECGEGADLKSFESRMHWDKVMIETVNLIEGAELSQAA